MLDMAYVTIQVCSIKIHNKANIEFLYKEKFMGNIWNFRDFKYKVTADGQVLTNVTTIHNNTCTEQHSMCFMCKYM